MAPSSPPDRLDQVRPALVTAIMAGGVLQLALALGGHFSVPVADLFPAGRSGLAVLTGLLFGFRAPGASRASAGVVGGISAGAAALPALLVSYVLADVPSGSVSAGGLAAVVAGVLGGILGRLLRGRG